MDNKKIIINIGRQFGSGGKATAEEIGRILGIPVYDAELLSEAAKKSGIREEIFSSSDERNRFWAFGTGIGNNEIFKIQSETIREIAQKGSAVFVGRASDYVLRDLDCCLDVFISAPFEKRLEKTLAENTKMSRREAEFFIQKKDKERADYYNFFTFTDWGAASNYDLCIDSAILGYTGTAEFIIEFARRKGLL